MGSPRARPIRARGRERVTASGCPVGGSRGAGQVRASREADRVGAAPEAGRSAAPVAANPAMAVPAAERAVAPPGANRCGAPSGSRRSGVPPLVGRKPARRATPNGVQYAEAVVNRRVLAIASRAAARIHVSTFSRRVSDL